MMRRVVWAGLIGDIVDSDPSQDAVSHPAGQLSGSSTATASESERVKSPSLSKVNPFRPGADLINDDHRRMTAIWSAKDKASTHREFTLTVVAPSWVTRMIANRLGVVARSPRCVERGERFGRVRYLYRWDNARAKATRCCCPLDNSVRPTRYQHRIERYHLHARVRLRVLIVALNGLGRQKYCPQTESVETINSVPVATTDAA